MKRLRMPFAVMLPLLELVVWVLLVAVPTTLFYIDLRQPSGQTAIEHTRENYGFHVEKGQELSLALYAATMRDKNFLVAANIPAFLTSLPLSVQTWPSEWHPPGLLFDTWRAVSFPILCLPFWWMAGRGIDALCGGRGLRWPLGISGIILSVAFAVAFIGVWSVSTPVERTQGLIMWTFLGLGLWILLFGVVGLVWIRQAVVRRRLVPTEKPQLDSR